MPTFDLSNGAQKIGRFDVVAEYSTAKPRFVAHVALHDADSCDLEVNQDVTVVHMGPPLQRSGRIRACIAGRIPLTTDEIKEVESWIAEIEDEYIRAGTNVLRQYVIHPPWEDQYDSNTGIRIYRRFSCAGFVLDAHRQVEIDLLETDVHDLPEIDLETLKAAYPDISRLSRRLAALGIEGDGPWKVILAGYVLHALNRPNREIRLRSYRAKPGDELF